MIHIQTTYRGLAAAMARGAGTTTRLMRVWIEDAYIKTLLHWHENMRPKHFEEGAASVYGYSRRNPEYTEGKRRSQGHTRPLVYSGDSERETERMQIRVTSKGGVLAMSPGNLAFANAALKLSPRKELTTVTDTEADELAEVFSRSMDMSIRSHSGFLSVR